MELPHTLAQLQYQNPPGSAKSAFQNAYNTEEHLFKWIQKHPDIQHDYNVFMTHQANSKLPWFDIFPVGEKQSVADQNPDCVTLVDVGGGLGGQIHAVQQRYPNLKGRMILQDLPFTTEKVLASAKFQQQFEVMSHDIFKPQPVKGTTSLFQRNFFTSCFSTYARSFKNSTLLLSFMPSENLYTQTLALRSFFPLFSMIDFLLLYHHLSPPKFSKIRFPAPVIGKTYPFLAPPNSTNI